MSKLWQIKTTGKLVKLKKHARTLDPSRVSFALHNAEQPEFKKKFKHPKHLRTP